MTFMVRDETKGTVVAERVQVADSFWARLVGLLGRRSLPEGHGLLLRPTSSIHTAFMLFTIDVVFLDREDRVVKVAAHMKPFRLAAALGQARSALELPAGAAARAGVERGDRLTFVQGA